MLFRSHCEHCLKRTINKGTKDEKTYYYHNVLEAKIVLGDNLIVSIATEFIENEKKDVKKQDCERKAFKRLAAKIKKDYPRLPICILGDSLYECIIRFGGRDSCLNSLAVSSTDPLGPNLLFS